MSAKGHGDSETVTLATKSLSEDRLCVSHSKLVHPLKDHIHLLNQVCLLYRNTGLVFYFDNKSKQVISLTVFWIVVFTV